MEPIVSLKEVDTYYLTFEVHFTIEFNDPMVTKIPPVAGVARPLIAIGCRH